MWIDELRCSLTRAGDHIADGYPTHVSADDQGQHAFIKLWHTLPSGAKEPVTRYIKAFAKEANCRVTKVKHSKFAIEFWWQEQTAPEPDPSSRRSGV